MMLSTRLSLLLVSLTAWNGVLGFSITQRSFAKAPPSCSSTTTTSLSYGDAKGDYYGESSSSFMVKELNNYDQLQEIVQLASQPLPERPDGIVAICKFTSATRQDCRATEAEYERMARNNPATIFLRCFEEYDSAQLLLAQAEVSVWPSFDIFYGGNRVARVEGPAHAEVEELLKMYQFQNSKLDLFSERADNQKRLAWGDGKVKGDATKTPRTTNRFIPGYDWDKDRGFFDDLGDKAQQDWDKMYGEWVPDINED